MRRLPREACFRFPFQIGEEWDLLDTKEIM